MRRCLTWFASIAFALAGAAALSGEDSHVSLVPWKVLEVGAAGLCAAHGLPHEEAARLREALSGTRDAPLAASRKQPAGALWLACRASSAPAGATLA